MARFPIRFRLATLLLLIAVAGALFAWALYYRNRAEFAGVWYYPTPDNHHAGYWETLTIREDGTFAKEEQGRMLTEDYSGTYAVAENGVVTFHVTQKRYDLQQIPPKVETFAVDKSYRCRVAVDAHGQLIVLCLDPPGPDGGVRIEYPESCDLAWYCYTAMSHQEQDEAFQKEMDASLNQEP